MIESNKLELLINHMEKNNIDGFIIPSNDAFQSEYVPAHSRRLEWLTGFSGSNGVAVVLSSGDAAFFTDGRYTIQAEVEVPECFERHNLSDVKPWEWLAEKALGKTILYDAWLHTEEGLKSYQNMPSMTFKATKDNPIDELWKDRALPASAEITDHPLEFSGISREEKLGKILEFINHNRADYLLLTAPDSICWLLNIRGNYVPCTPLVLSYALVSRHGKVDVFTESAQIDSALKKVMGDDISFHKCDELDLFVSELKYSKIIYNKFNCPIHFSLTLDASKMQHQDDPCQLAKAIKNSTEISGTKAAHIRDGAALVKGLIWVESNLNAKNIITESDVADTLIRFRKEQKHFKQPSFGTIAGFNENGAIVHYQAKKETAATLSNRDGDILLIDSGGQYLDGTTDITRTVALGTPSKEQKERFSLVLKGHISLASALFPLGTSGSSLDILARQFLWNEGLDYDHGTGHGVGSYLGVHEGPQRISKLPNNIALKPGMILSNEPGYYKTNAYGIRIESLVLVKEHDRHKNFLCFETISHAPIDLDLVEPSLLSNDEKSWLNAYHKKVYAELSELLNNEEKVWLKHNTREI